MRETCTEKIIMAERHLSVAIALATTLFNLREQLIAALRAAAMARIESEAAGPADALNAVIQRRSLELHVDDALYAIGRDGVAGLEYNVRHAVDEIVREALDESNENRNRERVVANSGR
jgi:hypothetical protein